MLRAPSSRRSGLACCERLLSKAAWQALVIGKRACENIAEYTADSLGVSPCSSRSKRRASPARKATIASRSNTGPSTIRSTSACSTAAGVRRGRSVISPELQRREH